MRTSQPDACRYIEIFLPDLEDQIVRITETKTIETRMIEITSYIERINKEIRTNNFDQVEKLKLETLKMGSQHKSIGLLIESVLNMKKQSDADKKRTGPAPDNKSLEKANQKSKSL